MKIFYDDQIFSNQSSGGISRYFCELIKRISLYPEVKAVVPKVLSNNIYLPEDFRISLSFFDNISFKGKGRLKKIVNRQFSKKILRRSDYDIFHPTYYDPYHKSMMSTKPLVITVYDMIHEIFPRYFSTRDKTSRYKKNMAERADRIIAISKTTKNDLCRLFDIPQEKVSVVYLGNSLVEKSLQEIELPEKYLLFIGKRNGYKNFECFVNSISSLLKKYKIFLLCIGGGEFNSMESENFSNLEIQKYVLQRNVSDNELKYCYKNALALVFPSLYEGFGLPIIESLSCGCPVLISNSGSLPEIAGDAGIYFDPKSKESILNTVSSVLSKDFDREKFITKGFNIANKFTWNKTAVQTLNIYKKLCNKD